MTAVGPFEGGNQCREIDLPAGQAVGERPAGGDELRLSVAMSIRTRFMVLKRGPYWNVSLSAASKRS